MWDASSGYEITKSDNFRGHFAQAYYERAKKRSSGEERAVELHRAIELAPNTAEYRLFRANVFADLRDFASVASELDHALEHGPRVSALHVMARYWAQEIRVDTELVAKIYLHGLVPTYMQVR